MFSQNLFVFVTFDFMKNVQLRLNLIPQTAILIPFRGPMPASSDFNILRFKPENFENNLKDFISSLINF